MSSNQNRIVGVLNDCTFFLTVPKGDVAKLGISKGDVMRCGVDNGKLVYEKVVEGT